MRLAALSLVLVASAYDDDVPSRLALVAARLGDAVPRIPSIDCDPSRRSKPTGTSTASLLRRR
jgi:hypothetical protein